MSTVAHPPPDGPPPDGLPDKAWLTAKEVAAFLEMDTNTVYSLRAAGRLRARGHGLRQWRFARESVLDYAGNGVASDECLVASEGPPRTTSHQPPATLDDRATVRALLTAALRVLDGAAS